MLKDSDLSRLQAAEIPSQIYVMLWMTLEKSLQQYFGCDFISVCMYWEMLKLWGTEAFLKGRQWRKAKGTTNVLFIACSQLPEKSECRAAAVQGRSTQRLATQHHPSVQRFSVYVRTTAFHTMIPPPGSRADLTGPHGTSWLLKVSAFLCSASVLWGLDSQPSSVQISVFAKGSSDIRPREHPAARLSFSFFFHFFTSFFDFIAFLSPSNKRQSKSNEQKKPLQLCDSSYV